MEICDSSHHLPCSKPVRISTDARVIMQAAFSMQFTRYTCQFLSRQHIFPLFSAHTLSPSAPKMPVRLTAHEDQELRLQQALKAIRANGLRSTGRPFYLLRLAACDFGVPKTTLTDRWNGGKSHHKAAIAQQRLTPAQEKVLVAWIKSCGARGMGLNEEKVIEAAGFIAGAPVGERWYRLFLSQNKVDLRGCWASGLKAPRAQCLNRVVVEQFFDLLKTVLQEYSIEPENMWNMDEKGIMMGQGQKVHILVDRNQTSVNVIEDGNREMVTFFECICANGDMMRPTAIFKGVRRDLEWGRDKPLKIR
jgi:hypothetical protein